jgi:hypothetical protein
MNSNVLVQDDMSDARHPICCAPFTSLRFSRSPRPPCSTQSSTTLRGVRTEWRISPPPHCHRACPVRLNSAVRLNSVRATLHTRSRSHSAACSLANSHSRERERGREEGGRERERGREKKREREGGREGGREEKGCGGVERDSRQRGSR